MPPHLGFIALGGLLRGGRAVRPRCTSHLRRRIPVCCAERGAATVPAPVQHAELSTSGPNVIDVLQSRGLFDAGTGDLDALREHCSKPVVVYAGFDPTADSLHLGNMLALVTLRWFQKCGHRAVALLGGATGRVGDPSGKSVERPIMSEETLVGNSGGIERDIRVILGDDAVVVNNYDWFKELSFLDFLRDVGRHARVNTMLAKDSVKSRLSAADGLSYTEFTYQLLQAYDFMHLSDEYGVSLQIGGSDQWGNITAGTELTRRLRSRAVHGVTFPLLTTADGKKFGKSESGAVWLHGDKLSPYQFYQHLFRTADADIAEFLRRLTFMPLDEIDKVADSMKAPGYAANDAQRVLAAEVTRLVHGDAGVTAALAATEAVKPGGKAELTLEALEAISADVPSVNLSRDAVVGSSVVDVMVASGLQKSKGEARRLLKNGGAYVNNVKVSDERAALNESDLVGNAVLLLAAGKKNKMLVRVE